MSMLPLIGLSQPYTSYFTGSATDAIVSPTPPGGLCMMGGATENDEAMKWFLERAYGGDVLVIRASGADGYNDYMYSGLGITVNSVETIVFNNASAAFDSYVLDRISKAEAVWIAGGDQWDYVSYWRNTPVDSLINDGIANRGMSIGGTSAGMAILGSFYFTAENGTISSSDAMMDPFHPNITIDSASFIHANYLQDVITDTHYDNPSRKGRHVVFLAHILENYGVNAKGIGCEEYTAVCVDQNGIARVFGDHPSYDDYAFFIQKNCVYDSIPAYPEVFQPGSPITWSYSSDILKVYQVPGTSTGSNTFNLNDWQTGSGGTWVDWAVEPNVFSEVFFTDPQDCVLNQEEQTIDPFNIYPNPATDEVRIDFGTVGDCLIELIDMKGKQIWRFETVSTQCTIDLSTIPSNVYQVKITSDKGVANRRLVKN